MTEINFSGHPLAIILPGQASQEQGIGVDAYESCDDSKRVFEIGSETVGTDLLMFAAETKTADMRGPLVQVALAAAVLADYKYAKKRGLKEDIVLGHSVQEITALASQEALDLEDFFKILMARGFAMDEAFNNRPSIMTAVIGPTREQFKWLVKGTQLRLKKQGRPLVYGAMYNSERQNVASGDPDSMDELRNLSGKLDFLRTTAKTLFGAEVLNARIRDVKLDGGSHSPYMEDAVAPLFEAISRAKKRAPNRPVLANDGTLLLHPDQYAPYLSKGLIQPVDWLSSIWRAVDLGVRSFVEVEGGDAQVLSRNLKHDFSENTVHEFAFGNVIHVDFVNQEKRPQPLEIAA